jgi:hypothetical protein
LLGAGGFARQLTIFFHTNPRYQELSPRVRVDRLPAKVLAEQTAGASQRAELLARSAVADA